MTRLSSGGSIMKDDEKSGIRNDAEIAARAEAGDPAASDAAMPNNPADQVLPESYRSCLDAIPDLMALKGEELEYLFVNKAYCELLKKGQDEIAGKRAIDIFPKDVARKLETMDLLVLASSGKSIEEVRIDDRIFEIRKFPVSLRDRGLVVVNGRDITERKEAEATLLTEKIRFQIVSDNAPLAMILLDDQGSVKYVNMRFKEIFGYDADDVPDGTTWFRRAFPDREYETDVVSVISRPDEVDGWKGRERRVLTAICCDGTQRIVSLEAVQLPSGDVVVSCDDVAGHTTGERTAAFKGDYDVLTGLPNRSSMERAVRNMVDHAREGKKRRGLSALLILAIQDFGALTQSHGTPSVDEMLVTFAKLLKSILRTGDAAYRSGDNQFGVVFKGISLAEARLAAERIHKAVGSFTFLPGTRNVQLDVAVGLVQVNGRDNAAHLLSAGEKAIARALTSGSNQIVVHEPEG
jgi:diguanylate cyclase (GGDEF)-like protein/PAS domain S-box-containing protein